jgi:hypothetical protein
MNISRSHNAPCEKAHVLLVGLISRPHQGQLCRRTKYACLSIAEGRRRHRCAGKVEGPEPKPAYRQVLVKVAACSLNFRDLGIVRGTYRVPVQDHIVPLSDGAGEVVEVGAGVTRVKVGDSSPPASSNAGPAATRPRMYRPTRSVAASTAC